MENNVKYVTQGCSIASLQDVCLLFILSVIVGGSLGVTRTYIMFLHSKDLQYYYITKTCSWWYDGEYHANF